MARHRDDHEDRHEDQFERQEHAVDDLQRVDAEQVDHGVDGDEHDRPYPSRRAREQARSSIPAANT